MDRPGFFDCFALISFSEPVGEWVSHCLDFDVVTQGTSVIHAFKMLHEACGLVVESDLRRELDPRLRAAPEDDWNRFARVLRLGREVAIPTSNEESKTSVFAVVFKLDSACVPMRPLAKPQVARMAPTATAL